VRTIKIKINGEYKSFDILNDFLFHKVFGENGCQKELLYVINIFTEKNFKTLTYLPTDKKGEHDKHKASSSDVCVQISDEIIVNIESQKQIQEGFHKRSQFYSDRIQSLFLTMGDNHEKLPFTIMINIVNFNIKHPTFKKLKKYHNAFIPCEKEQRQYSLDDISETHFIELTKFRKDLKKGNIDLNNPKDRLMILLNEKSPEHLIKKVIKMDKFAYDVYKKAERVLQDRDGYLAYIKADMAERDKNAQIRYGKKEGIEIGKEENNLEVAKKLKNEGVSIEIIAKATGLSVSKIKEL